MPPVMKVTKSWEGPLSPEDALGDFLQVRPQPTIGADPNLELADLRSARLGELEDRQIRARATGDKTDETLAGGFFDKLMEAARSDSYTGDAAREQAHKNAADYTQLSHLEDPNSLAGQERGHNEAVALQKTIAEHPSTSGAPGPSLKVPGAVPVSGADYSTQLPPEFKGKLNADSPELGAALSNQPPEVASLVQGLLNYTQALPQGNARARYPFVQAASLAQQIDPSWNMGEYETRFKAVNRYKSGPTADRINRLNQAVGHLTQVSDAIDPLNNAEGMLGQPYNVVGNFLRQGSNPALTAFEDPAGKYAEEAGAFFHGSPSEQAAANSRKGFNVNGAPSVLRQTVGSEASLLQSGAQQLEDALKADLGIPANQPLPQRYRELLYHEGTQERLKRLQGNAPFPPPVHSGAAAGGSGGLKPGTEGVVNGVPAVWDGRGWLPK